MKKWVQAICASSFAVSLFIPIYAHAQPVTIYAPNQQATTVVKEKNVDYVYRKNGSLTVFLMKELAYKPYLKNYAVSKSERTVILSFDARIADSQLVQGSTGGQLFSDRIAVTFFNNMPKLERIQLRLDGKPISLDHVNFSGTMTRQQYEGMLKSDN